MFSNRHDNVIRSTIGSHGTRKVRTVENMCEAFFLFDVSTCLGNERYRMAKISAEMGCHKM